MFTMNLNKGKTFFFLGEASAPSFTEQLEAVEIAQGEIARFQAGVAGVPTPRVNWTREVGLLLLSISMYMMSLHHSKSYSPKT